MFEKKFLSSNPIISEDVLQLIEKAVSLRNQDINQSDDFLERALHISTEIDYQIGVALSLQEKGHNFYLRKKIKEAVKKISEANKIFTKLSLTNHLIVSNELLARILFDSGDYSQALGCYLQNLIFLKGKNDQLTLANTHNKTGEIYKNVHKYKKAIEQHEKALQIFSSLTNKEELSRTNFYIGNCYNWADELDIAFNYLDTSLKIADELNQPELKMLPLGSLGILFTKYKNFDKARDFFFRAIDNANLADNRFIKADLMKSLGNLFIQKKEYDKAEKILLDALLLCNDLSVKFPVNFIHLFLSDLYEKKGEFEKALFHYKQFDSVSKEISNDELNLKLSSLQLKYDMEELNREKAIAERTIVMKDEFLANLSHDILSPVNEMIGTIDLFSESKLTSEQKKLLSILRLSSFSILNTFNNIIDYTSIQQNQLDLKEEDIHLKTFLGEMVKMIQHKAAEKKIEFRFSYDDKLPEVILSDSSRLGRVFLNVIDNALKFTSAGTIEAEFMLLEDHEHPTMLLKVADTGKGMSDENLIQVLEPAKNKSGNSPDQNPGTGIGLFVTKSLVERMKGTISLNSRLNAGTVVKIELPLKLPSLTITGGKRKTRLPDTIAPSEIKILLIDDNKVNQFLGKKILEKLGFQSDTAGSGEAALLKLKSMPFDLILMDVEMPGINGYELTEMIRNTMPSPLSKIPIVALTAYASVHEREKALRYGMNDYVTKPYNPPELNNVILKLIKNNPADKITLPPSSSDASSVEIDEKLNQLKALLSGDENDFKNLVEMVVSQIPLTLDVMKNLISDKNWDELFQAAQRLKSTLKLFKSGNLTDSIKVIEENTRQRKNLDSIEEVFELLQRDCARLISQLQTHL